MTQTPFDTLYKQLNTAQKQAVEAIDGPIMVIAGPGTGKTTILTLRIANILKRTDTPAHGILAITYTDAGVKAMRNKLQNIIGERAHDVRIHTFHSFASSIISEYPDHFIEINDMKQITDVEQESIIRSLISDQKFSEVRPSGKPDAYISGIMRAIDNAKKEALNPRMVRHHAHTEITRIKNDESSLSTRGATKGKLKAEAREALEKLEKTKLFADIYELYEAQKRKDKKMDFNDLIIEVLTTLKNDELLLRLIQEKYLYIHVDEHQDTNDAQNFIVGLIAEFFETPNIFIVGDEKQAIYRFQGASVENFLLLQKKWPAMKVISLDTNYRSHQGILDASFTMIEGNYEGDEHKDLRIKLSSGNGDKARALDVVTGENMSASDMYLIAELQKIRKAEPKATVAIIVRRNRDLDTIIRLLESHAIPVFSERSVDIFSHPVGRIFFDLLEYLQDPSRSDALAKTIVAGMWGMTFEKSLDLIKNIKSGKEIALPVLKDIQKKILHDGPMEFLVHTAQESGFVALIAHDPSYIHVWRGIIVLAESLVREGNIHDPMKLVEGLLAYRLSAESKTVKVSVGAPDVPLQALTAHGSKGLEFDYVFIPYATEQAWIGRPRGESFVLPKKRTTDHDIQDTRRLFYVALTRARKHVTILTSLAESDGKVLTPLRFIDELGEKMIFRIQLPRAGVEELYSIASAQKKNNHTAPLIDYTKKVLLEKGLSVTALNHFVTCPNMFLYQSILKLPQAPAVSAEKGSAMHSAFDAVWKMEKRTAQTIENMLTEKIEDYFNDSFLSIGEKESAQKELLDDVSAVAKALEPHFIQAKGTVVLTESWVQATFMGTYEKKNITIPLHGKLDAIVDTGKDIYVFDYKTRQALSINAIKGETKSSDGNYFRQLVFYKILVGSDQRWKQRRVVPALVFVSPDEKGRCPIVTLPIEESDTEKVMGEIQSLIDAVWSGKITDSQCSDSKCEWCALRSLHLSK